MSTTLFTWELVVECSVARDYLESPRQPRYSADYQLVNRIEAIIAIHDGYGRLSRFMKPAVATQL